MNSITGSTAPLHRRFNEKDSLRQIRNRYIGVKEEIAEQIQSLQRDERFLTRCEAFYRKGYKDWHILSAILNLMVHLRGKELKLDLHKREDAERMEKVPNELRGRIYPTEEFLSPELDHLFVTNALTCLGRYGFENRGVAFRSEPVVKFLRERMKHFDLDIPHPPMFGKPPNDWPEV